MHKKFPFPSDPENWQAAYTADNAYYDAKPISPRASLLGFLTLLIALAYSILYLFNRLPSTIYWFNLAPSFVGDLDAKNLTEPIREAFKDKGRLLTDGAVINVNEPGKAWVINDGNLQYFIHSEPPNLKVYDKQLWFSLTPDDISSLDTEKLSDTIREAFKSKGHDLTDKAKIKTEQSGNSWIINDGDQRFFIRNEQQSINVYKKHFWFLLAPKPVHILNSGQLNDPIYKAFGTNKRRLTDNAVAAIEQPGFAWTIIDGKEQFFIRNEQPNINVYEYQHWFSLNVNSIQALDAGQLTDQIREVFIKNKKPLTAAIVQVIQPGNGWIIIDGNIQYIINNDKQNIKVYGKQLLFNLPPESLILLDEEKLTDAVHEAFKIQGTPLTSSAALVVEQPDNSWVIADNKTHYFVLNDQYSINVYKKFDGSRVLAAIFIIALSVYVIFILIKKFALRQASNFFLEFYIPPEDVTPTKVINYRMSSRVKLPMPFGEWFPSISQFKYILVQNGKILKGMEWSSWMACNIGGPILLIVSDGSALYIERGNRFSRVVGPGISFLERYETVKYAVDLRTKSNTGDFDVWTKDGISINLKVQIEYRIGDPQKTTPKLVYPYDPVCVKKAIERHSLRWPDPTKDPSEFTWEDAAWGQVTGVLPGYIGSRFLDDLLIADRQGGQILSPEATTGIFQELNKATMAFGVYVIDFQILSIKLPEKVEHYYVRYWEAEKQSLARLKDGKAKAFNIRAHEKVRADAQHDLILAIANGLRKNDDENGRFTEALLLSLSEILDHGLSDPRTRSSTAKETLEALEILQNLLRKSS